jgi:hypothetical protein
MGSNHRLKRVNVDWRVGRFVFRVVKKTDRAIDDAEFNVIQMEVIEVAITCPKFIKLVILQTNDQCNKANRAFEIHLINCI